MTPARASSCLKYLPRRAGLKSLLQAGLLAVTAFQAPLPAAAETLRMAVTTSFENSGLADVLLPAIESDTGIVVQLLVTGTGQALRLGEAGDVDAVLTHAREAEEAFVAAGNGLRRVEFMANDFVIVGPAEDPAGIAGADSAGAALARIAAARSAFVSRGDDSGTHLRERSLWPEAVDRDPAWYREAGAGMGATLNTAAGLDAYTLTDRATWISFGNKGNLAILHEGGEELRNIYAFIAVNPERHPHVASDAAARLEGWLTSEAARDVIDGYRLDGVRLFTWIEPGN